VSSIEATRPELEAAIKFARKGDTLVVTKLDRLVRSTLRLWTIVEELERKGVGLRILNLGGDLVDRGSVG
jgi:DNA invertase Pin-like site-specific DNA recombinase